MSKKQAVFTIVACSVAALILSGVLAVGLSQDFFGLDALKREQETGRTGDGRYVYETVWDPAEAEVTELDVEWINGRIDLKVGGSVIKITESSGKTLDSGEKLKLAYSGGALKIKWEDRLINFSLFQNTYKDLTVEVPKEVAGNLQALTCANTSGEIQAAGFTAEEITFSTASGSMALTGLFGEEADISTTSGQVDLKDVVLSEGLHVSSTSGGLSLSGVQADSADLNSVSGEITYIGETDSLKASVVSARVKCDLSACPKEADLTSVSGSLTLAIPESSGFEAKCDSVSGSFSCGFPAADKGDRVVYGSGGARFSFSTTSGDVEIVKK